MDDIAALTRGVFRLRDLWPRETRIVGDSTWLAAPEGHRDRRLAQAGLSPETALSQNAGYSKLAKCPRGVVFALSGGSRSKTPST